MYLDGMSRDHLLELKKAHTNHLQVLQIQQANFGLHCPPHIILGIQDVTEKIQNIDAQFAQSQQESNITVSRSTIKTGVLDNLITERLKHQVSNKLEFTAYDITLALRRTNPTVELIHREARKSVHMQMRLIVELGMYRRETTTYGNATARRYIPTPAPLVEQPLR